MRRCRQLALCLAVSASLLCAAFPARAAAPWIYRGIVLPRGDVALDFGLGYGHAPPAPGFANDGFGLNLELRAGVSYDFEIGFRTGFRLDDGGQNTRADSFGRPFDTETYGTNNGRTANPELSFRWLVARGAGAELGTELRAYLPIETNSRFGLMFGLPIALRAGPVRIDTGIYVPIIFYDPTLTIVSIPLHIWIQASYRVWLGPLLGLRFVSGGGSDTQYPLGFGLGIALNRALDLRTWLLFPDMSQDAAARTYGAGVALQIRFE